MAYTTHLQQVIQYLKQGGKIKPAAGAAGTLQPDPTPPALPFGNKPGEAGKPAARMPSGPPPKMSK
jgi:hypothetical protein